MKTIVNNKYEEIKKKLYTVRRTENVYTHYAKCKILKKLLYDLAVPLPVVYWNETIPVYHRDIAVSCTLLHYSYHARYESSTIQPLKRNSGTCDNMVHGR